MATLAHSTLRPLEPQALAAAERSSSRAQLSFVSRVGTIASMALSFVGERVSGLLGERDRPSNVAGRVDPNAASWVRPWYELPSEEPLVQRARTVRPTPRQPAMPQIVATEPRERPVQPLARVVSASIDVPAGSRASVAPDGTTSTPVVTSASATTEAGAPPSQRAMDPEERVRTWADSFARPAVAVAPARPPLAVALTDRLDVASRLVALAPMLAPRPAVARAAMPAQATPFDRVAGSSASAERAEPTTRAVPRFDLPVVTPEAATTQTSATSPRAASPETRALRSVDARIDTIADRPRREVTLAATPQAQRIAPAVSSWETLRRFVSSPFEASAPAPIAMSPIGAPSLALEPAMRVTVASTASTPIDAPLAGTLQRLTQFVASLALPSAVSTPQGAVAPLRARTTRAEHVPSPVFVAAREDDRIAPGATGRRSTERGGDSALVAASASPTVVNAALTNAAASAAPAAALPANIGASSSASSPSVAESVFVARAMTLVSDGRVTDGGERATASFASVGATGRRAERLQLSSERIANELWGAPPTAQLGRSSLVTRRAELALDGAAAWLAETLPDAIDSAPFVSQRAANAPRSVLLSTIGDAPPSGQATTTVAAERARSWSAVPEDAKRESAPQAMVSTSPADLPASAPTGASAQALEGARVAAESARVGTEGARVAVESARVGTEGARVATEGARVGTEDGRVAAEDARVGTEGGRVAVEGARVAAENTRAAAASAASSPLYSTRPVDASRSPIGVAPILAFVERHLGASLARAFAASDEVAAIGDLSPALRSTAPSMPVIALPSSRVDARGDFGGVSPRSALRGDRIGETSSSTDAAPKDLRLDPAAPVPLHAPMVAARGEPLSPLAFSALLDAGARDRAQDIDRDFANRAFANRSFVNDAWLAPSYTQELGFESALAARPAGPTSPSVTLEQAPGLVRSLLGTLEFADHQPGVLSLRASAPHPVYATAWSATSPSAAAAFASPRAPVTSVNATTDDRSAARVRSGEAAPWRWSQPAARRNELSVLVESGDEARAVRGSTPARVGLAAERFAGVVGLQAASLASDFLFGPAVTAAIPMGTASRGLSQADWALLSLFPSATTASEVSSRAAERSSPTLTGIASSPVAPTTAGVHPARPAAAQAIVSPAFAALGSRVDAEPAASSLASHALPRTLAAALDAPSTQGALAYRLPDGRTPRGSWIQPSGGALPPPITDLAPSIAAEMSRGEEMPAPPLWGHLKPAPARPVVAATASAGAAASTSSGAAARGGAPGRPTMPVATPVTVPAERPAARPSAPALEFIAPFLEAARARTNASSEFSASSSKAPVAPARATDEATRSLVTAVSSTSGGQKASNDRLNLHDLTLISVIAGAEQMAASTGPTTTSSSTQSGAGSLGNELSANDVMATLSGDEQEMIAKIVKMALEWHQANAAHEDMRSGSRNERG